MISRSFPKILLIEDDEYFRSKIRKILENYGVTIEADTMLGAKNFLETQDFDLILIDMNLAGQKVGLKILEAAKLKNLYSIILTDNDEEADIKKAYEIGCDHYLTKDQCEHVIEVIVRERLSGASDNTLKEFFQNEFITQDEILMNEIRSLQSRLIQNRSILLLGETGVGKSKIAELIHKMSGGKKDNFISVNVSAVPENLIESEFFGHVKGAFTGASENRIGKLKLADGGTLFLDEIGTMPLYLQKKLLKALEEKSFCPVGASKTVHSQFRLITATCENIYKKIQDELFRLDLFYRINGIILDIPPLRKRKEYIPILLNNFMQKGSRRIYIKREAMQYLESYFWPGNIRELKAIAENLSIKKDGVVEVKDLPNYILQNEGPLVLGRSSKFISEGQLNYLRKYGLKECIEKIEVEALKEVVESSHGIVTKARNTLKLSRSGFYRLLKKAQEESPNKNKIEFPHPHIDGR